MNGIDSFGYRTFEHLQGVNVMSNTLRTISSVESLKDFCSDCETLYMALAQYTGNVEIHHIIDDLKCNDTLCYLADENNMESSELERWIINRLDASVECRVFHEHGPSGSWPVVEIKCLDKVFYLDWITD